MIFSYSLSLPLESRQRLYITDASTLAGLYVLGSFSNEITDSKIVLRHEKHTRLIINPEILNYSKYQLFNFTAKSDRSFLIFKFWKLSLVRFHSFPIFLFFVWWHCTYLTFCVGFHLSQGNSPLCGSSTGGCKIDMHRSPFCTEEKIAF